MSERTEQIMQCSGMIMERDDGVGVGILHCTGCNGWHMHIKRGNEDPTPVADFMNEEAARCAMFCFDIMSGGKAKLISADTRDALMAKSEGKLH